MTTALLAMLLFQAPPDLTLQNVVEAYVQRNLELQATRYQLERTRADQVAAGLRPNPGLNLIAENIVFSGPTPLSLIYEVGGSVSQTFELGGKRELRQRVADLSVSAAEAQFANAMRQGVAEVKRLYYDAVLARYHAQVAAENRQTFDQLLQLNQVRFSEGAIPESDLIKVRLERIKFDSALKKAELNLRQATIRLQGRIGDSVFAKQNVSGDLEFTSANPTLESLRQLALTERPDIRAAMREVEVADERLRLEQARAKPDVTPFFGYKRAFRDNTVLFGLSMPLRINDKNQAGIARAQTDAKTARAQLHLARNRALAEVEAAFEAFQSSREQVQTFRSNLLGQADESRSIALAAYEEGGTDLLPVLEAQRTRAEVRDQYFRTLFDYRASLVDLELAIGREIQP